MTEDRWLKTAYSYLFIRDFVRAMDAFRSAIHSDPENPQYYFHASITAVRNGDLEEGEQWAGTAVILEPNNDLYAAHYRAIQAKRMVLEGLRLLQCGDTKQATERFHKALELDPLNPDAEYYVRFYTEDIAALPDTGG